MALDPVTRGRLEVQGFACSDDPQFARMVPWLRFSPALCTLFMGIGSAFAFTPLLWAMVPVAALGAIFPVHPFDYLYNYGIRQLAKTPPLPPNGAPRRFACGVAAVWLVLTALAFGMDVAWLGYLLGAPLTAVAAIVTTTHFCIPSTVFRFAFRQPVDRS